MLFGSGWASTRSRTRAQAFRCPFRVVLRTAVAPVACPPRPSHTRPPCLARHGAQRRMQPPPSLPPYAHPSPPAACHSFAREHTRALRAHVRHFSFFAFTSSPLCRKSLYGSRFGVKDFPKMLHRGEASAPHPFSDCNRPPNDRSTRTHPGGENHEKFPAKCRKAGATAP